jgi:CRISPR-associated exonuclease Cas4
MDAISDIPISALEHYSYCPRQFGLIHIERVWDESEMTLQGSRSHERADIAIVRHERGKEVWRAVPLWSERLNLFGRADVVEVLDDGTVLPVEYKRGDRKLCEHERIQLCAQALCLEEMLGARVGEGALYHAKPKRLTVVLIDDDLRFRTVSVVEQVQRCFDDGECPPAVLDARCESCSLLALCLPEVRESIGRLDNAALFMAADVSAWAEEE